MAGAPRLRRGPGLHVLDANPSGGAGARRRAPREDGLNVPDVPRERAVGGAVCASIPGGRLGARAAPRGPPTAAPGPRRGRGQGGKGAGRPGGSRKEEGRAPRSAGTALGRQGTPWAPGSRSGAPSAPLAAFGLPWGQACRLPKPRDLLRVGQRGF